MKNLNEEQQHANQISERIVQLGDEPNLSPDGLLSRSRAEYVEGQTVVDMIREDLVAKRVAIDSYRELVQYLVDTDPTSHRVMESILAVEEEHADEMADLLERLPEQMER